MKLLQNKTFVALVGAVLIPLAALLYLAGLPDGGRGSLLAVLLQGAIVLSSVFLFVVFLAKFVEQINARRVRRWLDSDDGREWLAALPADERSEFLARLQDKSEDAGAAIDEETAVDRRDARR